MRISDWSSDVCSSDLKTRPQFLKVAGARRKWVTPGLVLQAAKAPADAGEPEVRVGFTVTRKVGNAVERNRVKRRLRAAAAEVFPSLGCAGTDYVVVGRMATLTRPFSALKADLEQAVRKLRSAEHTSELQPLMRISYAVF